MRRSNWLLVLFGIVPVAIRSRAFIIGGCVVHLLTYDPDFKEIFSEIATDEGMMILKSIKVGTLPLEIDAVLEVPSSAPLTHLSPIRRACEITGAQRFVIEFKGPTDPLKLTSLRKLIAYRELFLIESDVEEERRTACVVISTRHPRSLLSKSNSRKYEEGVYSVELSNQKILVIVINRLRVIPENYGLLVFSSSKRVMDTLIDRLIDEQMSSKDRKPNEEKFISYTVKLDFESYHRVAMRRGVPMSIVLENIKKAIDELGIKSVIDEVGLREVVEAVGVKDVVKELGVREVVKELGTGEVLQTLMSETDDPETLGLIRELMDRLA